MRICNCSIAVFGQVMIDAIGAFCMLWPPDREQRRADGLLGVVGYPSGQRGQTVNLLAHAFDGSNPSPTTNFSLSQKQRFWPLFATTPLRLPLLVPLVRKTLSRGLILANFDGLMPLTFVNSWTLL